MNVEKLKRLQAQVRIGGKGTPRRKKKVLHQTAATDDKKLQSSLKKLSVSTIPGIEEVNIIKDDLTVIHFNNPKAQASLSANTFAVTGHGETKKIVEMLPEILPQLGQETVVQLRMFANSMSNNQQKQAGGSNAALDSVVEEDDVPLLVGDFDEVAKVEAENSAKQIKTNKPKGKENQPQSVEIVNAGDDAKQKANSVEFTNQVLNEEKPAKNDKNLNLNVTTADAIQKLVDNKNTSKDAKKAKKQDKKDAKSKEQSKIDSKEAKVNTKDASIKANEKTASIKLDSKQVSNKNEKPEIEKSHRSTEIDAQKKEQQRNVDKSAADEAQLKATLEKQSKKPNDQTAEASKAKKGKQLSIESKEAPDKAAVANENIVSEENVVTVDLTKANEKGNEPVASEKTAQQQHIVAVKSTAADVLKTPAATTKPDVVEKDLVVVQKSQENIETTKPDIEFVDSREKQAQLLPIKNKQGEVNKIEEPYLQPVAEPKLVQDEMQENVAVLVIEEKQPNKEIQTQKEVDTKQIANDTTAIAVVVKVDTKKDLQQSTVKEVPNAVDKNEAVASCSAVQHEELMHQSFVSNVEETPHNKELNVEAEHKPIEKLLEHPKNKIEANKKIELEKQEATVQFKPAEETAIGSKKPSDTSKEEKEIALNIEKNDTSAVVQLQQVESTSSVIAHVGLESELKHFKETMLINLEAQLQNQERVTAASEQKADALEKDVGNLQQSALKIESAVMKDIINLAETPKKEKVEQPIVSERVAPSQPSPKAVIAHSTSETICELVAKSPPETVTNAGVAQSLPLTIAQVVAQSAPEVVGAQTSSPTVAQDSVAPQTIAQAIVQPPSETVAQLVSVPLPKIVEKIEEITTLPSPGNDAQQKASPTKQNANKKTNSPQDASAKHQTKPAGGSPNGSANKAQSQVETKKADTSKQKQKSPAKSSTSPQQQVGKSSVKQQQPTTGNKSAPTTPTKTPDRPVITPKPTVTPAKPITPTKTPPTTPIMSTTPPATQGKKGNAAVKSSDGAKSLTPPKQPATAGNKAKQQPTAKARGSAATNSPAKAAPSSPPATTPTEAVDVNPE